MPWMKYGNILMFLRATGWEEDAILRCVSMSSPLLYGHRLITNQVKEALLGLSYLHRMNVVHGDLHPVRGGPACIYDGRLMRSAGQPSRGRVETCEARRLRTLRLRHDLRREHKHRAPGSDPIHGPRNTAAGAGRRDAPAAQSFHGHVLVCAGLLARTFYLGYEPVCRDVSDVSLD